VFQVYNCAIVDKDALIGFWGQKVKLKVTVIPDTLFWQIHTSWWLAVEDDLMFELLVHKPAVSLYRYRIHDRIQIEKVISKPCYFLLLSLIFFIALFTFVILCITSCLFTVNMGKKESITV